MCHPAHINSAHEPKLLDHIIVRVYHLSWPVVQLPEIHMATLNMFHSIAYFQTENQYRQTTETRKEAIRIIWNANKFQVI